MTAILYALRPKHWIKNAFIFMPLIFGQRLADVDSTLRVVAAFLLFSLTASSVYLINDVIDIEKDKHHRVKKLRPIPSGKISIGLALAVAAILALVSLVLSFPLNWKFSGLLAAYFVLNLIYSSLLKDAVILDVFCIAVFFFIRVAAGTVVAGVDFSHWMIFMMVLLALFLGFNKRRQELLLSHKEDTLSQRSVLGKYSLYFIDQMIGVLTSSMVVVYMIYTVDERTVHAFGTNHLTFSIPFVYYGIFRYLYLIHKRRQAEDPVLVVFSDKMMQLNLLAWMLVCVGVIYWRF